MTERKIYILGAGFSKTFGLPLANEFLSLIIKESKNDYFKTRVMKTCQNFYANFRLEFSNYPNIEDFYNYFCTLKDFYILCGVDPNKFMLDFFPEFLFEVADYLNNKIINIDVEAKKYIKFFCARLNAGDIVITFNWDNLLERFFEEFNIPFGVTFTKDKIVLVKLHGSIDWIKPEKSLDNQSNFDIVHEYEENGTKKQIYRCNKSNFINVIKEINEIPYFIPPVYYKNLLVHPLKKLWHGTSSVLREISHKYVIGYSLPKEDILARVLLSTYPFFKYFDDNVLEESGLMDIINPDDTMEMHFKRYCHEKIVLWKCSYQDYVDLLIENKRLKDKYLPYKDLILQSNFESKKIFSNGIYILEPFEIKQLDDHIDEINKQLSPYNKKITDITLR